MLTMHPYFDTLGKDIWRNLSKELSVSLRNPRTTARRAKELRDLETSGALPRRPLLSGQPFEVQADCIKLGKIHQCNTERAWKYVLTTQDIIFLDIVGTLAFLLEEYQPQPWDQDPPSWTE
jgi:hypothetical protein